MSQCPDERLTNLPLRAWLALNNQQRPNVCLTQCNVIRNLSQLQRWTLLAALYGNKGSTADPPTNPWYTTRHRSVDIKLDRSVCPVSDIYNDLEAGPIRPRPKNTDAVVLTLHGQGDERRTAHTPVRGTTPRQPIDGPSPILRLLGPRFQSWRSALYRAAIGLA
ncbi:hypothetical protein LZ30DRAFT_238974 [Colletotrichum cereale]|nr:hypothetical protein LZ30DRAFT_238974 [Colletotrichum cereale]